MGAPNISSLRHTTDGRPASLGGSTAESGNATVASGDRVTVADPLHALRIGEEKRVHDRQSRVERRRLPWRLLAAALGIGTVAAGIWFGLRQKATPVQVTTVLSAPGASGGLLTAGGYVRHAHVVNVVPRVSGIIATLDVSEGDTVHEGDLIATLDRGELEQQVAESRADLRATQAHLTELQTGVRREEIASARARVEALQLRAEQFEREEHTSKALADANAISARASEKAENESLVATKMLESEQHSLALLEAGPRAEVIAAARASVDAARARLMRATDLLQRTEIRAPLSGRVLRKFLDVGSAVSFGMPYTEGYNTLGPGSPIVTIGQLEGLEAVADINQVDFGRISLGEKVEVSADAFPGKSYVAHVTRFSPRADRNKSTIEVTVRFDDPIPNELAHDMSVKLGFLGSDQPAVVLLDPMIPASAIVEVAGHKVVFVVDDGRVRARRVTVGASSPSKQVSIRDGLVAGDVIVIANPGALSDGMKVAPASAVVKEGDSRE